jgi:hypothetical protein
MENIKDYTSFNSSDVNESFWNSISIFLNNFGPVFNCFARIYTLKIIFVLASIKNLRSIFLFAHSNILVLSVKDADLVVYANNFFRFCELKILKQIGYLDIKDAKEL